LEQKYRSPYTGNPIPLSRLFTAEYEIEHIIPQMRYFDDSFSNKVICESAVNKLKDKQLGFEFIKNHHGAIVETGYGRTVKVLDEVAYQLFVKENYAKSGSKRNKLLLDEIPDKMIERQMNDTRYISKFISSVLSSIVREDNNDEGVNSKNVLPGNGKITSALKQDWGLNDIWNDLILPRFERMNRLTGSTAFTAWNNKYQKFLPTVPLEYSKGFQKKRIDHRHHALDALVIACATRDHVNLFNNQSAKSALKRYDLQHKLRNTEKWIDKDGKQKDRFTEFKKPWADFTVKAKDELEKIVVSFKQNLRVINKTTNKYERLVEKNGKLVKELVPQAKGDSWAIRKPMHKDTVSGEVKLVRIKVPKGKILTATRKSIDTSFNVKAIDAITDTGIQKILRNYLSSKGNKPEIAFTPEGLEEMNKNIMRYNDGKRHQPIYKVRVFEVGSKFPLGQSGNKNTKFVEAAKGTNLFFAIYRDENEKRTYETVPLNVVIERQKQGLSSVPETNDKGSKLFFHLSPNDLVYIPSEDERDNISQIDLVSLDKEQVNRIYKMVSSSGSQCFFVRHDIATSVVNKMEYSPLNKMEKSIDGIMIKESCIKLEVDRLGNIKPLGHDVHSSPL
jgi:CRISPR-associated endonuclease Csn1